MKNKKSQRYLKLYYDRLLRKRRKEKGRIKKKRKRANKNVTPLNSIIIQYMIYSNHFIGHFANKGFIADTYIEEYITAPSVFSFKKNLDNSIFFFKQVFSSFLIGRKKTIIIDFSKCNEACISCFTFLDIFFYELNSAIRNYNQKVRQPFYRGLKIIKSNDSKVAKYLHIFRLEPVDSSIVDVSDEYLLFGLEKGKQRTYKENKKSVVSWKIVNFINESIQQKLNYTLRPKGINAIDGFVTEVLGNAEDHSLKGSEWYVNGVSFAEVQHDINIVELNLSIINIGKSMYEGFEETKVLNNENYQLLERLFKQHSLLFTLRKSFNKESLMSFYLLKEGYSRLKYERESRGNGTMNFINAFMVLGSFGEKNSDFLSDMNIISGHTVMSINNNYKPYVENGVKEISLNREKDITLLPDKECLFFNKEYFPGTILECKIYLNKDFFKEKLKNGK